MQEAPGSSPGATTVVRGALSAPCALEACVDKFRKHAAAGLPGRRTSAGSGSRRRTRGRSMSSEGLRAAIFDVDGVLVASPHERAWREALAEVATTQWGSGSTGTFAPERFTSAVYQEHVAGKARLSG